MENKEFLCLNCGYIHREDNCPKCGSQQYYRVYQEKIEDNYFCW